MASEIRVNQIQNRSGLSTVTFSDTGLVISGITTISGTLNASEGIVGTVNSVGVSTFTTLNATSIVGVNTLGVTTAYVGSINNGPLAGFRNAIINGNFDIWQRGTSFTADGYGADRWRNARIGTTCTMSRQAFTLGQTDVPGEPTYFCRMQVSSVAGASNLSFLQQRIESVRTFAEQQVTVSFWAKADSTKPIAVELAHRFGTGGGSSDIDAIGVTKVTLGTSWQKVTVTANVPSISGKTLGSDSNDYLSLGIWFDAGSNFNSRTDSLGQQSGTFDIAQVQVEAGPVATPFEKRPIGTELALCQRYYEKSYQQSDAPGTNTVAGAWYGISLNASDFYSYGQVRFAVTKRAAPTINVYSTIGTFAVLRNLTANVNQGNAGAGTPVDTQFRLFCNNTAMTANNAFAAHWTADAEL